MKTIEKAPAEMENAKKKTKRCVHVHECELLLYVIFCKSFKYKPTHSPGYPVVCERHLLRRRSEAAETRDAFEKYSCVCVCMCVCVCVNVRACVANQSKREEWSTHSWCLQYRKGALAELVLCHISALSKLESMSKYAK